MDQSAPVAPWAFEVVGPLLWLALAGWYAGRWRRERTLSTGALVFLGATTMCWQEWHGDWGGYVLYNPHLHLLSGWHWRWTGPNKPWAVLPAYGWFYGLVYLPLIALVHRWRPDPPPPDGEPRTEPAPSGTARPDGGTLVAERPVVARPRTWPLLLAVGLVAYYLWDLLIEGVASVWGLWSYVHHVGPALASSRGTFPLVYPIVPFALMMALTAVVIDARRPDGTPSVEALARVPRRPGWRRELARVGAWAVAMNLCYLVLFIAPVVAVRELFLPASALVP